MKKFQLADFVKAATAFWVVSASGIDSGILALDQLGIVRAGGDWYLAGPLIAWSVVSLPLSISLGERLVNSAFQRPGAIKPVISESSGATRAIPFTRNGIAGTLMASVMPSIFGNPQPAINPKRSFGWVVPVGDQEVKVSETELKEFLHVAHRRAKYQFSRRYFTERRRPRLAEPKYNAYMLLLEASGVVENRGPGSSGEMIKFPTEALLTVKRKSGMATLL